MADTRQKVVIIGGGVSGLVCLRHLQHIADVTLFEGRSSVGGLWDTADEDSPIDRFVEGNIFQRSYGCQFRNIFHDLVMNIPTLFANFKDFPHDIAGPQFLTREEFHKYVKDYVSKFDLMKNVRLNAFVTEVKRRGEGDKGKPFTVATCNSANEQHTEEMDADFVVVANGHNTVPNIPVWDGEDSFPGPIIHAHDFRKPNDLLFARKSILVVGGSYSGLEMLSQFFAHPKLGETDIKKIYFSGKVAGVANTTDFKKFIENGKLELIDGIIEKIEGKEVSFTNKQKVSVETIIACTGYKFSFPFLQSSDDLVTVSHNGSYFGPLYKRTFAINEPRLCFLGNVDRTCFIQKIMEFQALVLKNYIQGNFKLPDKESMLKDLESDLQDFQGDGIKNFFKLDCAAVEDNKMIREFFKLVPALAKDEDLIKGLDAAGKKAVEFFARGDPVSYRAIDFYKYFTDFKCHST